VICNGISKVMPSALARTTAAEDDVGAAGDCTSGPGAAVSSSPAPIRSALLHQSDQGGLPPAGLPAKFRPLSTTRPSRASSKQGTA
jgi:hypothetical protein